MFLSLKRLERGWKVLIWERVRALCNKKLPKKKIKTWRFTKTLKSVMKEETWKKTPSEDFWEVRLLVHNILEDSEKTSQKSFRVWYRSEKPAYPNSDLKNTYIQKRSNGFKKKKNDWNLYIYYYKEHIHSLLLLPPKKK